MELSFFSPGQSTVQSPGMLALTITIALGTHTPYNSAEYKKKEEENSSFRKCQGFKCGLQKLSTAEPLTSETLAPERRHNTY